MRLNPRQVLETKNAGSGENSSSREEHPGGYSTKWAALKIYTYMEVYMD